MKTSCFLPSAVQTPHHGELCIRRQVMESELPGIRASARQQGIVFRSVRLTSDDGPDQYWLFSQKPIKHNYGDIPNNITQAGESRLAAPEPDVPRVAQAPGDRIPG